MITKFELFEGLKMDLEEEICNFILTANYDKVKTLLNKLDDKKNAYVLTFAILADADDDFISYLSDKFDIDLNNKKIKELRKNKKVVEEAQKLAIDKYTDMLVEEDLHPTILDDTAIEYSFYIQKEKNKDLDKLTQDQIFEETRVMVGLSANFEVEPEELFETWLYVDDFDKYHDPKSNTANSVIQLCDKLLGIKKVAKKPVELTEVQKLMKKFNITEEEAEEIDKLIDKILDMDDLDDRMDYVEGLTIEFMIDDEDTAEEVMEYLKDICLD